MKWKEYWLKYKTEISILSIPCIMNFGCIGNIISFKKYGHIFTTHYIF